MATLTQINAWIDGGWKKNKYARWLGGRFGIDTDGWYGFQCKDLVNAYAMWLGHPFTAGNAESLARVKQDSWWTVIPPTSTPKAGDVFVMWWSYGGIQYGHTGIVRNVYSTTFRNLAQNWVGSSLNYGSPPAWVTNSRNPNKVQYGIRCYLRPRLTSSTPAPVPTKVYYTVKSGDTVGALCAKYKISLTTFKKLNPTVTNVNLIHVGQKLRFK